VFAPDSVYRKLVVEQEVTLLTYCHIREDAFLIFGFLREEERVLFKMLLGISGIGPKVSLAILSAMSVAAFRRAVEESDVQAFTRVSGVGKKTAQRVVLEMKAKLGQDAELSAILGEPDDKATAESDDVIAALCSLGCSLAEARKAAATARKQVGAEAPAADLVRAALRSLARV
jgi:Holliday junction DNA helicase RuvA